MTSSTTPGSDLVPVKFSRLTRRGILLGLSLSQLVTLGVGIATLVWAFYAGGGMLIALTAPIWVLSAALTWIPLAGRPIVEWVPVGFWWIWKTTGGQLLYRRRIVKPRPAGTLALPGDTARLRPMLKGVVTEIGTSFAAGSTPELSISGSDGLYPLIIGKNTRHWEDKAESVAVEDVAREAVALGAIVRSAVERVIDQTAPRLAVMTAPDRRRELLGAELRAVRRALRAEFPRALRRLRSNPQRGEA